jgi:hypothetical protein
MFCHEVLLAPGETWTQSPTPRGARRGERERNVRNSTIVNASSQRHSLGLPELLPGEAQDDSELLDRPAAGEIWVNSIFPEK